MGAGIQIKKPEHLSAKPGFDPLDPPGGESLPVFFYMMLVLIFPAAMVALYFFMKTRTA